MQAWRAGEAMTVSWQDQPGAVLVSGHRVYYGLAPGQYLTSAAVHVHDSLGRFLGR